MAAPKKNEVAKNNDGTVTAIDEKTQKAMNKAGEFEDRLSKYTTAEEAMHGLSELFGGVPFADQAELSITGESFRVTACLYEAGQGHKGADRWNLSIVTQFGEPLALTLGVNPTRNGFMTGLAKLVARFGSSPEVKLQAIAAKDVGVFYIIVPADQWKAPSDDAAAAIAEIIESREKRLALAGSR